MWDDFKYNVNWFLEDLGKFLGGKVESVGAFVLVIFTLTIELFLWGLLGFFLMWLFSLIGLVTVPPFTIPNVFITGLALWLVSIIIIKIIF